MRFYKAIIIGLLIVAQPVTAGAQFSRQVSKEEAKAAAKAGARAGAKTAAKKVIKELGEGTAEGAAKSAAKVVAKEISGEVVEHTAMKAGRYAVKSAYKNVGGASIASVSKRVGGKEAKQVLKDVSEKSVEKSSKAFVKKGGKQLVTAAGTRVVKEGVRESAQAVSKTELKLAEKKVIIKDCEKTISRNLASECQEKVLKNAEKRAVKGVIKGTREEVEHVLGKRGSEIWSTCFKEGSEEKTRLLLKEISENPDLHRALTKNPGLLKSYYQLSESPFRTDITMLRYVDNGAGKYSRTMPRLAKAHGYGDDLVIKTAGGNHSLYDGAGNFLGTISGNSRDGYIINASAENRKLLNLYPMNNATYKCGDITWITDRQGRVRRVQYSHKGAINRIDRNKQITVDAKQCKNSYNVNGNATHTAELFPNDEGGHLISLQNGGSNDLINLVGQSQKANRAVGAQNELDGIWIKVENSANKALRNGKHVSTDIELHYSDNFTMRPKSFTLTQEIDGKIDEISIKKGKVIIDHVTISNE